MTCAGRGAGDNVTVAPEYSTDSGAGRLWEGVQPEPARRLLIAGLGMVGIGHPALIGAAQAASAGLIGAMAEGGAEAIASRGQVPADELLDRAAMESGTD